MTHRIATVFAIIFAFLAITPLSASDRICDSTVGATSQSSFIQAMNELDVAFVMDLTGSMEPFFQSINHCLGQFESQLPQSQLPSSTQGSCPQSDSSNNSAPSTGAQRSVIRRKRHIFVSYSHNDDSFVDKILGDLERHCGFTCWRDIRDGPAGPLDQIVQEAIREARCVLLVLSKHAVASDWVEYEANFARSIERHLNIPVLLPISLDNDWLLCRWSAALLNQIQKCNVLDFSEWRNDSRFSATLQRLVVGIEKYYT